MRREREKKRDQKKHDNKYKTSRKGEKGIQELRQQSHVLENSISDLPRRKLRRIDNESKPRLQKLNFYG